MNIQNLVAELKSKLSMAAQRDLDRLVSSPEAQSVINRDESDRDSQNAWLRQIHTHNFLFVNPKTAAVQGIADGGWMWAESMHGKVRCMCRYSEAVEPGTVWTWNAIGKAAGAWGLDANANESQKGFLLNHLIGEELPAHESGDHVSNSDPITGQAGWFDVRVRIYPAGAEEPHQTSPQFEPLKPAPGMAQKRPNWFAFFAGKGEWK